MPNLENAKEDRKPVDAPEADMGAEQVATVAADIATKAQAVADGSMTPEAFVDECIAALEGIKAGESAPEESFGGVAGNALSGGLALPPQE